MDGQLIFAGLLVATLIVFSLTVRKYVFRFSLTGPHRIRHWSKRLGLMLRIALGQSRIFRRPVIGFFHALTFWGFCIITLGSVEMVADGLLGTERSFAGLGFLYNLITGLGDVFALLVLISIGVFLLRRIALNVKRFHGIEMKKKSHIDAVVALVMIFLLMVTLLGFNTSYLLSDPQPIAGTYPVSAILASLITQGDPGQADFVMHLSWWSHIILIFIFANLLPYSKHFHVFMSIPNVLLSRLEPLGKAENMTSVMNEVESMLYPEQSGAAGPPPERFGLLDAGDISWKGYLDALTCTECGRCTDVCPANRTGKLLSPRKLLIDLRARMKEMSKGKMKNGRNFQDGKTYLGDYISAEEIWACTLCNACARECPVNINQPSLILDMRRYLVMEKAAAPAPLNMMFSNIENNGAPWQYGSHDRLNWVTGLDIPVPVMANLAAQGKKPEYLLWIGCAGAFDDRYQKVARAMIKILHHLGVDYAVLGTEETCNGDPARRAGNEMLFHMQALALIETFRHYDIRKIITLCPHCFNTFLNEYPDLGFSSEVVHYSTFLETHVASGKLKSSAGLFKNDTIVFHDPCYLGRANGVYQAPRILLSTVNSVRTEMERSKSFSFCCGAGGSQYFKEAEKGSTEVFIERTGEAVASGATVIASSCPFCLTMLTDGVKYLNKEGEIRNLDVAEILAMEAGL
ncbi:MAG: (Fe-S)-binding protein [Bacteroidales bacterium]